MNKLEIKGEGEAIEVERGRKYRIKFKYKDPNTRKWKYAPQRTVKGNKAQARRELEEYKKEFELDRNKPKNSTPFGDYTREWQDNKQRRRKITAPTSCFA